MYIIGDICFKDCEVNTQRVKSNVNCEKRKPLQNKFIIEQ